MMFKRNTCTSFHSISLRVLLGAISVLLSTVMLLSCSKSSDEIDSAEKAHETIAEWVDRSIKPSVRENTYRANINLANTTLLSMLPDLADYPIGEGVVLADSDSVESLEIFASSEKTGTGRDGYFNRMAAEFNSREIKLSNGKQAAVAIRKIASGLGSQFILAEQYVPDAFSPSNKLWGDLLRADGVSLDTITNVSAPNTAGIIVKKSKADLILTDGALDIAKLIANVTSGDFAMSYTNPFQSSTGLNFLLTVLHSLAEGNESKMFTPDVSSAFLAFQSGVPFVAQNALQMRNAVTGSGVLDAMVMEYQSWVNVTGVDDFQFVPFGIRHDSPIYATSEADESEREVLDLFVKFIGKNKVKISSFGFAGNAAYKSAYTINDGSIIEQAQKFWKQNKSGGQPVAAVFVADVSGSMEGTRLEKLQQALIESSDLISSTNAIGLVTYNEHVNVDLQVREFDLQQKSLFAGAVECLVAGGRTATNDAVIVAIKLINDFLQEHPDHKAIVFVLADGVSNRGLDYQTVEPALGWGSILIHSIAYEVRSDELKRLSALSEGAYIESSERSASYRIGNLLNSEM
ncbi:VWA domain-containing protein [bacterium]|nr:VWA domain-containing protein [bacterium]